MRRLRAPISHRSSTARLAFGLASAMALSAAMAKDEVIISVAPLASVHAEEAAVGRRAGSILNLQIWQTLRKPPTPDGRRTRGVVTWDVASRPPATFSEAEDYAAAQKGQEPQLVLWGRAWRYGTGTVVEAFLSIRSEAAGASVGEHLWTLSRLGGEFSVGIPHRQVEFAPIVLRSEILPALANPAGLSLYAHAAGKETLGKVGDYFTARETGPDSTKVVLPDGRQGWVRLPQLARQRSEVVDFAGGIVRILRSDWDGAGALFAKVVDNANAPLPVKADALLYLAIAAARAGRDASPWVQKVYDLAPYSRTTLQFLCMARLAQIRTVTGRPDPEDLGRLQSLIRLLDEARPLYSLGDPWFHDLRDRLDKTVPERGG